MKMLTIDQAANASGWSIWNDNKLVEYGVVYPHPKSLRGGKRLSSLRIQFGELIERFQPTLVVIEDPVGDEGGATSNWKTMQTLCQVQGMLLELIASKGREVEIMSPSTWQNLCGIHRRERNARKTGAVKYVLDTFGLTGVEQDAIDAICIGSAYLLKSEPEVSAF